MPTAHRRVRSLLALALVANLLVASAPASAYSLERHADAGGWTAAAPLPRQVDRPAVAPAPAAFARDATIASRAAASATRLPSRSDWISRPKPAVPRATATAVPKGTGAAPTGTTSFTGRNRMWIPALGIARSVTGYACSSSAYPGNRVYRWGCAGSNNIYLFGHAHSVFRALHDAYVGDRLRKGMKVYYAGGDGRVAVYAISWWKLTTPDKGAWAFASLARPSLTLQTCVGAKNQYRLIVRLAKVG